MRSISFLVLAFGLAGCGAASDTVDEITDAKTATLHGSWRSEDGASHPASLELVQRDLSVTLTMKLDGHSCLAKSELEAKLTFDGIETTADVAGMHLVLSGGSKLDQIVGNFEAIEQGPCQRGWVSVVR